MPAAMKHMCTPSSARSISPMLSSAAARPTSGRAPAPSPWVMSEPSWMRCSAIELLSACASVLATTKSTPSIPALIMLPMALPPAPPTPITVIRGRSSSTAGAPILMLIQGLLSGTADAVIKVNAVLAPFESANQSYKRLCPQPLRLPAVHAAPSAVIKNTRASPDRPGSPAPARDNGWSADSWGQSSGCRPDLPQHRAPAPPGS